MTKNPHDATTFILAGEAAKIQILRLAAKRATIGKEVDHE